MRKKFILQTYKNFLGFGRSRPSHLKVAGFRVTEFMTTDLANDWQNKLLWVNYRKDKTTPFSIYAGSRAGHHQREAALRDAQGATNIAEELANHRLAAVDDGALSPARPDVRPTPETDSVALHFGLLCITAMYHRNVYR
jgi:hypothetical protein